jgi:hypothetical protein
MLAYIKKLLQEIATLVSGSWSFLTGIWNLLVNFKATLGTFVTNAEKLVSDCLSEFEAIKNFEFDPKWNTRVISVPRVKENLDTLIAIPTDILTNCKAIVDTCKRKLEPAEFNAEDLKFLPEEFGKFLGKVLGWAGLVVDCFVSWNQAILDAQHIVDDIKALRTNIENLDGLFLPQNSVRKTVDVTYRKRKG